MARPRTEVATPPASTNGKRNGSLTAAAKRYDLAAKADVAEVVRRKVETWQRSAWGYFDEIGEVKFGYRAKAHAVSKVRLFAAVVVDPGEPPIPIDDPGSGVPPALAATAIAELGRLRAKFGGQPEILRALALNLDIAGDCSLVGLAPRNDDGTTDVDYDVYSVDEIIKQGNTLGVGTDGKVETVLGPDDFYARFWIRHPRRRMWADCAMRGVLGDCETLLLAGRLLRSELRSAIPAGLLLMPSELSFGSPNVVDDGDEGDVFMEELTNHLMAPVGDEMDSAALVPPVVRGKGETLAFVRTVDLGRKVSEMTVKIYDRALERVLQGVDFPPELVTGMANLNHWSAWLIDDQVFENHVEPTVRVIVDALSDAYLRTALVNEPGATPELLARICVWYDPTDAIARPDEAAGALELWDRQLVSDDYVRRVRRVPDDAAPDDAELARRTPVVPLPDEQPGEPTPKRDGGQTDEGPPPPDAMIAAGRLTLADVLRRAADADARLFARLLAAADMALRRALERAGNRARSAATPAVRASLRNTPPHDVVATLGPAAIVALGLAEDDLIAGALDGLRPRFDSWVTTTQARTRRAIAARLALDDDYVDDWERAQVEDRDRAWAWLATALAGVARARLFAPDPGTARGETVASLVPPGVIRQALSLAGGVGAGSAGGFAETKGGALLVDDGRRVAGLAGLGERAHAALSTAGYVETGFTWVHGDPERPFEPHERLDGESLSGEFDPKLIPPPEAAWLDTDFMFPGDHVNCGCLLVPRYERGSDVGSPSEEDTE